jgi:hypothetical protein
MRGKCGLPVLAADTEMNLSMFVLFIRTEAFCEFAPARGSASYDPNPVERFQFVRFGLGALR